MEGESDVRFQMDQADVIVIDLADITLQYNTIQFFDANKSENVNWQLEN